MSSPFDSAACWHVSCCVHAPLAIAASLQRRRVCVHFIRPPESFVVLCVPVQLLLTLELHAARSLFHRNPAVTIFMWWSVQFSVVRGVLDSEKCIFGMFLPSWCAMNVLRCISTGRYPSSSSFSLSSDSSRSARASASLTRIFLVVSWHIACCAGVRTPLTLLPLPHGLHGFTCPATAHQLRRDRLFCDFQICSSNGQRSVKFRFRLAALPYRAWRTWCSCQFQSALRWRLW